MRRAALCLSLLAAACGPSSGTSTFGSGGASPAADGRDPSDASSSGEDDAGAGDATSSFAVADGSTSVGAACASGTYVGTYQGTNNSSMVGGPTNFPVSGPMDLDLVHMETPTGESILVTNNGSFEMTWGGTQTGDAAVGIVVVQAAITGQLDCSTRSFSAMSTSATWTLVGIMAGTATLTFMGTYDASTETISGSFNVTDSLSVTNGAWSVTLSTGDP